MAEPVRGRHLMEVLFRLWIVLVVLSVLGVVVMVVLWAMKQGMGGAMSVRPAWILTWGLFLAAAGLWLEPLKWAYRPERLRKAGQWKTPPQRYDRWTLRWVPAMVPLVFGLTLMILEMGYGVLAPAGRAAAPEGLRFGIAAAVLVSVLGAVAVSQMARARFRREVEWLGDCFGCGYSRRGAESEACPECGWRATKG
ncbi:MAG: hypothetical protein V3V20_12720 [Algisphaera sp.]